jgi:hypothetical protein
VVAGFGLLQTGELDDQQTLSVQGSDQSSIIQRLELRIVLLSDGCPETSVFRLRLLIDDLIAEDDSVPLHSALFSLITHLVTPDCITIEKAPIRGL